MKFIAIKSNSAEMEEFRRNSNVDNVVTSVLQMYQISGQSEVEPWVGYLCIQDKEVLGTCAYKSAPKNNQVEIAYFVFPQFERKGLGTLFASFLVAQARLALPGIVITAQTLPENNASTRILSRLNFQKIGDFLHPEDGKVWQWLRE